MKLFLLSQTVIDDYDTFDSCVVVAEDAIDAVTIHPASSLGELLRLDPTDKFPSWPARTIDITCKYLGEADPSFTEPAVICASFNAG